MEKLTEIMPELEVYSPAAKEQVEIAVKYEGYLERQEAQLRRAKALEDTPLAEDIPYGAITGLRIEAMQKLNKQKPRSLAAASRIPGVSPADVAVLMVWLERNRV